MADNSKLPPLHPGEVLREEFLGPLDLTPYALAKACRIPRTRIERIVREETGITVDTALRLARYFDTTPEFWMNLQTRYEMESREPEIRAELEAISHEYVAA
ncbi:MAG: HigA family addiction module antitoxin [Oricola sp.]